MLATSYSPRELPLKYHLRQKPRRTCPQNAAVFRTDPPRFVAGAPFKKKPGGFLLSQRVAPQVPSASEGLTSVFGMGTGLTLPVKPPGSIVLLFDKFHRLEDGFELRNIVSQASRPISTGELKVLPLVHIRPINHVIYMGS